jgi:hypothetical protein
MHRQDHGELSFSLRIGNVGEKAGTLNVAVDNVLLHDDFGWLCRLLFRSNLIGEQRRTAEHESCEREENAHFQLPGRFELCRSG